MNGDFFKGWLIAPILSNLFLLPFAFSVAGAQDDQRNIHDLLYSEARFPSANTCRTCHPQHYEEWSVSSHAYAQLSPITIALQAAVTRLTNGTNGDFCIRCHNPTGMNLNESVFIANRDRHPISREGVTCVACHRRRNAYGKVSGRLALVKGDLFETIYGPNGNEELSRVIRSGDYDVGTGPGKKGRAIHAKAQTLAQITTSAFCGSCHDVNHVNGFRLEEAFSEYKSSPAARKGISCQDCHMGKEPGVASSGYARGPVAIIGGKPTASRKRTDHMFVGPDSSIIHPGIFPHNPAAQELATFLEWLEFDHEAGWGTDDFEDNRPNGYLFPDRWLEIADRYEARAIINENFDLLEKTAAKRKKLLRAGYQLGEVVVGKADGKEISFRVEVRNGTNGHNVPTGFDAERIVFLQIAVRDRHGRVVFESGDLDPNGDLRDSYSIYVHNGELPLDKYLFNLQSKFLVRMIRGGEREQVLPINYSPDPLPFIRPSTQSTLLLGRPPGLRKHRQTIPPLRSVWATYKVKPTQLAGSEEPYTAKIKLIAGMIPINLIRAIEDYGFDDYGMSARDVADGILKSHLILWEREILLEAGKTGRNRMAAIQGKPTGG